MVFVALIAWEIYTTSMLCGSGKVAFKSGAILRLKQASEIPDVAL